jgi:CDGSH-type Zn-finger protein
MADDPTVGKNTVQQNGGSGGRAPDANVIRVLENGPLDVTGDIHIADDEPRNRARLCRCGGSENKPFCDDSHRINGFIATGEPPTEESGPLEAHNGKLQITPFPNGPLGIAGPVEICSGTGHTLNRTTRIALCRCGHSKSKPYCDGSHRRVGFTTE